MAGFHLQMSGLSIPGIESGVEYVDLVASQFQPLAQMQQNWGMFADGIEAIRQDAGLSENERLDSAEGLHQTALATYNELVNQLQAERNNRLSSIDQALFGAPGVGLAYNDAVQATAQEGFRNALLNLSKADETELSDFVETSGLTGDTQLLRAARVMAHRRGYEDVVQKSVLSYGSPYERERYVERLAIPSEGNLAIITGTYAPAPANLVALTPDLATQRRAQEAEEAREARRQRARRG